MIKRFCNTCKKEITTTDRFRMVVNITTTSNGVENKVYDGEFDFCPACMEKMSLFGNETEENTEKTEDVELKPEDC